MYALILDALDEDELSRVLAPPNLIYGGAPMPLPLAQRIGRAFPRSRLWTIYGLTESGPSGTTLQPEDGLRKLGSVGTAQVDVEIEIRDDEGNAVATGESGEISIRTPARMCGYLDDEEATAAVLDSQGWLRSGDVGRVDEGGFLFLLDRKNDVIIRGGFNIYPAEIESALAGHDAVREAAVVGVPHDVLGEDVKAFVVLADGGAVGDQELKDFCAETVADFKRPRIIEFVDSLPRNAMGKVLRRELRGQAVSGSG
jgi:acyl-CoA synthetase (AMP-forming)/AMP-acid ligase II